MSQDAARRADYGRFQCQHYVYWGVGVVAERVRAILLYEDDAVRFRCFISPGELRMMAES